MLRKIFDERFASLSSLQEAKSAALSEEYRKDVADVQSTALWHVQKGGMQAFRALSVIAQLGETAVESVVAVLSKQPVPDSSLLIEMVKGVGFAETAVTRRLNAALNDSRMVPQPPGMLALEEVGPPYRICDEVYTALRRIHKTESLLQNLAESRHFLSLPEEDKNQEIRYWLRTGTFTSFLQNVDADEGE